MPTATTLETLISASNLDKVENDLDRAYQTLAAKLAPYNQLWDYYDGDQPIMYTNKRLRDIFKDLEEYPFVENWCAVVIDAANDRIELEGIHVKDKTAEAKLQELWEELNLSLEADDAHEAALVIGESFILVWPETSADGETETLQIFYNDPRLCHLFYDPSNPRKKWYAAKWWIDGKNHVRITLYYSDRLEYYRSQKDQKQVNSYKSFDPFDPTSEDGELNGGEVEPNPLDEVPFFHYRPKRRIIKSDLANIIAPQNGINKLVVDMMVAAEFGAFRQRWVISNSDTASLKNAPNEIWEIPAGDGSGQQASVGDFDPTDLSNYIKAIDSFAAAIAVVGRTPKHYFFGQAGELSGEALIAMEAPLNKRCADHIDRFTPTWKEVAQFMLKASGIEVEQTDIVVAFAKPETIQPKTEAEIRAHGKTAGIPLITLLRDEGKDDAWIEQMKKDKKEEQEASGPMLALLEGLRKPPPSAPPGTEQEEEEEEEEN